MTAKLDQQCINTLRFLSVDMVQNRRRGRAPARARPCGALRVDAKLGAVRRLAAT